MPVLATFSIAPLTESITEGLASCTTLITAGLGVLALFIVVKIIRKGASKVA